jgi:hypothetical protein
MDDPSEAAAFGEAFKAWRDSIPASRPEDWRGDALRRHNAERCRAILATVGIGDDGGCATDSARLRAKGLAENSAQWIAALWLAEYNTLIRGRERFEAGDTSPNNIARMLMATEEMGRLHERMWWRAGVDPISREKRENLALTGRPVKRGQKAGAEKTNKAHAPRRQARFVRMKLLVPTLGIENAARQCEAEGLGGWQGIRKQWDRFKEKPDT